MIKNWGVAFELFEVAVVGVGILFASKRHERDKGALESFQRRSLGTRVFTLSVIVRPVLSQSW